MSTRIVRWAAFVAGALLGRYLAQRVRSTKK